MNWLFSYTLYHQICMRQLDVLVQLFVAAADFKGLIILEHPYDKSIL